MPLRNALNRTKECFHTQTLTREFCSSLKIHEVTEEGRTTNQYPISNVLTRSAPKLRELLWVNVENHGKLADAANASPCSGKLNHI